MIDLWRTHVAWRFQAHPPRTKRPTRTPTPGAPCAKCKRVVEDPRYLHCKACRSKATHNAKSRARKRKADGLCPRCGGPRGLVTVVCDKCLKYARDKYHAERGHSDMAPA